MKIKLIFLLVILVIPCIYLGQEMKSWNSRFGMINYHEYQSSRSPDHLLIVDAVDGEMASRIAEEMIPVANRYKAKFILVELTPNSANMIDEAMSKGIWSISSIKSTTIVTYKKSISSALRYHTNTNRHILVYPNLDSSISEIEVPESLLVSIIGEKNNPFWTMISDNLVEKNIWLNARNIEPGLVVPAEALQESFLWMDSLSNLLSDSMAYDKIREESGIMNSVPEVLRQGRTIKIELNLFDAGNYSFEVLNLSTESVFQMEKLLGKGNHIIEIPTKDLEWGVYILNINGVDIDSKQKFMIRG